MSLKGGKALFFKSAHGVLEEEFSGMKYFRTMVSVPGLISESPALEM